MKLIKQFITLFLAVAFSISCFATTAFATDGTFIMETAIDLPTDVTAVDGRFDSENNTHYYKFTVDKLSVVYFEIWNLDENYNTVNNGFYHTNAVFYKDSLSATYEERLMFVDTAINADYINYENYSYKFVIDPGTYYLALSSENAFDFRFRCYVDPMNYDATYEAEPNNSVYQAYKVLEDEFIIGHLSPADPTDYLEFTINERRKVNLYIDDETYDEWVNLIKLETVIYKKEVTQLRGLSLVYSGCRYRGTSDPINVNGEVVGATFSFLLEPGTYIIKFNFEHEIENNIYKFQYTTEDPVPTFTDKYGNMNVYDGFSVGKMKAGEILKLNVIDGEVVNWKLDDNNGSIKINKNGKITALKKGVGRVIAELADGTELSCLVEVSNKPKFCNEKSEVIKSVTVKQGKKVAVRIKGKAKKINNKYASTDYAKIIGNKKAKSFKVKGLKKGTSVIKVKINCSWYKLTVKVI